LPVEVCHCMVSVRCKSHVDQVEVDLLLPFDLYPTATSEVLRDGFDDS